MTETKKPPLPVELRQRARYLREDTGMKYAPQTMETAADRIEALESEVERLRKALQRTRLRHAARVSSDTSVLACAQAPERFCIEEDCDQPQEYGQHCLAHGEQHEEAPRASRREPVSMGACLACGGDIPFGTAQIMLFDGRGAHLFCEKRAKEIIEAEAPRASRREP